MKTRSLNVSLICALLAFFPLYISARTVDVLTPNTSYPYDIFSGSNYSTFRSYLTQEATLANGGGLASYQMNDSSSVIVNLVGYNASFTSEELVILNDLLNSDVRVIVFLESSQHWGKYGNAQIADLVGGLNSTSTNGTELQAIIENGFPEITDGVSNVQFGAAGKISPKGSNGISLTSDNGMTLWGENDNFLLFMDCDALMDTNIGKADNDQLARNLAKWLAPSNSNIPEPSTYGILFGLTAMGFILVRKIRSRN